MSRRACPPPPLLAISYHPFPSLTLVSLPPSGNGGESSIRRTCASTQPGTPVQWTTLPPAPLRRSPSLPPPFSFVRSHSFREVISKVNTTGPTDATGRPGGGSGGRRLPSLPPREELRRPPSESEFHRRGRRRWRFRRAESPSPRILGGGKFRLRAQLVQGGQIKFWALGGAVRREKRWTGHPREAEG